MSRWNKLNKFIEENPSVFIPVVFSLTISFILLLVFFIPIYYYYLSTWSATWHAARITENRKVYKDADIYDWTYNPKPKEEVKNADDN